MIRDLFRPWRRAETWWSLTHVLLNAPILGMAFVVLFTLAAPSLALLITFPLALPFVWLFFVTARIMGALERVRFAALLGIRIDDAVPPLTGRSWWARLGERVRSAPRWREIGYLAIFPLWLPTTVAALVMWCGSAALLALPLYVGVLPGDTAKFWLFEVGQGPAAIAASLVGAVGLALVAPWGTLGLAHLDVAIARRLLGPRPKDELSARVTALESSRAAAVDSAESERRRIERDLHDGAQQRLVSLAMGLGAARQRLDDDPDAGRRLVAEAHEDAKAALRELRDLVRGIHPVILEDRGLDAALSAVVARSPVPVTLDVDLGGRLPPAVESAAYFVVTEALTNVARHAEANQAVVTIARAGLRNRVTGLGGTMHVVSPQGGPTTLLVEIPCGS